MKLVSSLRDLLHQTSQERLYALESVRYDVVKDLQNTYGKLITHTDLNVHFDGLIDEIKRALSEDGVPESHRLQKDLTEVVERALSRLLPSTFLCLSMGECISASSAYVDCMTSHSQKWIVHFGKEPEKIIRRLHESITRYKLVEKRLEALQNILINAEKTILPNCVERYANLTRCGQCFADRTSYCWNSCEEVASDCYLGITTDWDENIEALQHLVKDFGDGFYPLEKGIHNSLRRLVETTSPHLARDVVEACGALTERSTPTRTTSISKNVKPKAVAKKTERLITQLQTYRGHWKRISRNFCSEPSQDNFCWNGTNIVRATTTQSIEAAEVDHELPAIIKDVRPRPIDPRIEGSGAPISWSDDEDLVEGSGSGNDFEDSSEHHDVFATTTFAPVPTSSAPPTPLIVEQEIFEIETEKSPDSASLTPICFLLSALLLVYLF